MSKRRLSRFSFVLLHHKELNMIRTIGPADYPRLMEIWESAVLHTHDFLTEEDFLYYKGLVPSYFPQVALLGYEQDGRLTGFIGTAGDNIEMLFIDNAHRGEGIGKALVSHVLHESGVTKVDVNAQNAQAVGFYKHLGFRTVAESERDGEGKPYPILHMVMGSQPSFP